MHLTAVLCAAHFSQLGGQAPTTIAIGTVKLESEKAIVGGRRSRIRNVASEY